jgi:pimeloyl-ACP methyl ester carboxylesterase
MHGGKQNRADETIGLLQLCQDVAALGFNVLSLDRRGCGESDTARLNERTKSNRDFHGATDWILQQNPSEAVFLFGTSFAGVAALIHAGKDHRISGVVADSSFKSSLAMAKRCLYHTFPPFKVFAHGAVWAAGPLCGVGDGDDAIDAVKNIRCPVLFSGGELDKVVPPSDAVDLRRASANPLDELLIVPDAGHSCAYLADRESYVAHLDEFFKKCLNQNSGNNHSRPASPTPFQ